jgi:hypothetical protein
MSSNCRIAPSVTATLAEEIKTLERSIEILEGGLEYLHRKLWLLRQELRKAAE